MRSVLRSSGWISVGVGSAARGRMDLNMHVGRAVRRECPFFVPVPSYNKVNTNNIKKKKSRAIPVAVSESDPVEVPRAGECLVLTPRQPAEAAT